MSGVANCAAYTSVDRAERERDRAFAVNSDGAGIVARLTAERRLPMIHLSTEYVYSGAQAEAYREEDPPSPINVYGASKAAGDAAVAAANPATLMLRVSWVFGVQGSNFVKTMLRLAREGQELRVVNDQAGGPTEARDIADAVLALWAASRKKGFRAWGTYNFAGAPNVTWFEFASAIFEQSRGPKPRIVPVTSRDFPTAAIRPLNSELDCAKIGRVFGVARPDWRTSLMRVLNVLEAPIV